MMSVLWLFRGKGAAFGVYWGGMQLQALCGRVHGTQSQPRAQLQAAQVALKLVYRNPAFLILPKICAKVAVSRWVLGVAVWVGENVDLYGLIVHVVHNEKYRAAGREIF